MTGGWIFVTGRCLVCKRLFTFNPYLVPSHPARDGEPVVDETASKEPLCEACVTAANTLRAQRGQPQWDVPPGAYEPEEGP